MPENRKLVKARVTLKVHAGAKTTAITGRIGDAWKISVAAPPVDGKANDAVLRFFTGLVGKNAPIRIVAGMTSRTKVIEVEGITAGDLDRVILKSHGSVPDTGSTAPRQP